ncbi:MAG: FlgD immunoglobulin-like domain containing protein, partial [Candidatus Krumholzibacteria bacterium]|nr:FlgD immunoglobulin-like domain containing protein [Candidatus Krumholzibacteria bacterium]
VSTQFTEPGSGQGSQPSGEPVFEGTQNSWVENTVDLSAYEEESDLRFRFLLSSDSSVRKDGFYFDDFSIVGTVVSTDAENPVYQTALRGAWPNPFNPKTSLRFELESRSVCRISVHDVRGREIALLQDGPLDAGSHDLSWDGRNHKGRALPSGVYFARMQSGGKLFTQKLTLLK